MTLRHAIFDDAAALLAWRNDAVTRAQSRQSGEIGWDDHCRWLARVIGDPDCLFLIGCFGPQPCGFVRFNRDAAKDLWEVSIAVTPAQRGHGLGRRLLPAAIDVLRAGHPGARVLAAVRSGNQASEALFRRCGFRPAPSTEEFLHFMLEA
nr:GNAT family N-acetyltransferase [Magnetospirillum sulfuroxidans]